MTKDLNDYYYLDYLEHFGVKGMKWGVRKKPRTSTKTLRNNASVSKMLSNKNTKRYVNSAGDVRSRGGMALDRLGNVVLSKLERKRRLVYLI